MKLLRSFMTCMSLVLLFGSVAIPKDEVRAALLFCLPLTYLAWRAPYCRFRPWEGPLWCAAVALATLAAYNFVPEGQEKDPAFQAFFAAFIGLGVSYGFLCTAVHADSPLRREVIGATAGVAGLGVFDLGKVIAPFCFPFFLLRYYLRRKQ